MRTADLRHLVRQFRPLNPVAMVRATLGVVLACCVALTTPATAQTDDPVQTYIDMRSAAIEHGTEEYLAHNATWGMSDAPSYDVDLMAGLIEWELADGRHASAPVQLIGTWHANTFLWGWAHPSAPPGTAVAAQAVREWGTTYNINNLIVPQPVTDLNGGGDYAMMASYLGQLEGVYPVEVRPGTWAYFGFGPVTFDGVRQ